MKKIVLILLVISVSLSSCFHKHKTIKNQRSKKFSQIIKSKDVDFKYKMAEQYYVNKKYNFAQQLFEDLFPAIKGTDRYEDMYYKIAFCYYYQKDYLNAENYFKTFTETFPGSARTEECEYMRAYTFYKQSPKVELDQANTTKTIGLMQAFINTHPTSKRLADANNILDLCREKLELKEYKSAELYYNLGFYKAAAIAFSNVSENFPDSKKGDDYKLQAIKAYYKYAEMSYPEKQTERFEKVLSECTEFADRFVESKLLDEVNKYKKQTNNLLKKLKNE